MFRVKLYWTVAIGMLVASWTIVLLAPSGIAVAEINPSVAAVISAVNLDSLSLTVKILTGVEPAVINGRTVTIKSRDHETAVNYPAEYLRQKLLSYGYTVRDQVYGVRGHNVYAMKPGDSPSKKYFIICAHYDAFPYASEVPAADDNATGVAAVLEAARILRDYQGVYSLLFAFWDEEEVTPGMLGSRHFADSVAAAQDSIGGVVDLEMIGWDGDHDNAMSIHTKPVANSAALAQKMAEVNATYSIGLVPTIVSPGEEGSDHEPFLDRGYGAVMELLDGYNDMDPNYHSYRDTFANLNLPYFHKMAKLGIGTIASLTQFAQALPVELAAFTVRNVRGAALLQWHTATEVNNYGFDIERSTLSRSPEASPWMNIGFVSGKGTTQAPTEYLFRDRGVAHGTYAYRLQQIDNDGTRSVSAEQRIEFLPAQSFALNNNYPNPFNPSTRIQFVVGSRQHTRLTILDVLGRVTATLVDEVKEPGVYDVEWNTLGVPGGVYFSRMRAGEFEASKKILLVK